MRWLAAVTLFVAFLPTARAGDGVVVRADGSPAAGAILTFVGSRTTVSADDQGRFSTERLPRLPLTVVVIGRDGTVYPPLEVVQLPRDGPMVLELAPVFREEITAVAGIAPGIDSLPGSATTMLGSEELEIRTLRDPAEAVEELPGAGRSEKFHAAVPSLRGMTRGRTLILFDGSPLATERRAGVSATFVDPFTLEGIDIARGPGSVTYGSDAFGGVIDLRPRYPREDDRLLRWRIQRAVLARGMTAAGLEWSEPIGRGALLMLLHIRDSGNSEDPSGRTIVDSSWSDSGFATRWRAPIEQGWFRAGLTVDEGRDIGRPSQSSSVDSTRYPVESSRRVDLGFELQPEGWLSVDAKMLIGQYRLLLERENLVSGSLEISDVKSWDTDVRISASREAFSGLLAIGSSVSSRLNLEAEDRFRSEGVTTRSQSIADADRVDAAVFSTWDRAVIGGSTLSLGARVDSIGSRADGESFGHQSSSHAALSGYLAMTTRVSTSSAASLQLSRGFRDPSLSDRYFTGPTARGFITGNPDLEPERSLQLDGLWRWSRRDRSVTISGFSYRIDDLIERYREGRDYFFRNEGLARIHGLEIEGAGRVGAGLRLDLAAAFSRGHDQDGDPLDGIEPPNGRITLRWSAADRYIWTTLRSFLADDRPGPSEVSQPAFTTVDLGSGWQIRPWLEVRLNLENLLNRRYPASADPDAVFAPGRSVSLTFEGRVGEKFR